MSKDESALIRCTTCRAEFDQSETEGASACPRCGSTGVPMWVSDDVTIKINLHELRILSIWADNWAREKCDQDVQEMLDAVLRALGRQLPGVSLTMEAEFQRLADALGSDVEVVSGGQRKTIKPEEPN